MATVNVTDENFEAEVKTARDRLDFAEFHTTWR